MPGVYCPQCGTDNREQARFCSVCGALLKPDQPKADQPSPDMDTGDVSDFTFQNQKTDHSTSEEISPFLVEEKSIPQESVTGIVLMGRYRLLSELGRGGYGAVYHAWDIHLNKAVAIKENLDTTPDAQRQFGREASILAHLSHPNLVRVTDHFALPGEGQYLVMDFVDGEDIETLIKRQGTIPLDQALAWCNQVMDALEYIHSRQPQVLHRDIKPANIRINPDGRALLVDFGLVKINIPQVPTTYGARGVSPGYAPPEQYGKGKTDVRSDVYSLCATLYHMLTGQKPLESVLRSPERPITPAHLLVQQLPLHVSMAIQIGMAMEPDLRYHSVKELRTALLADQPSTSPSIPATQLIEEAVQSPVPVVSMPVQPAVTPPKSKPKTHSLRIAMIILTSLIVLGVLVLFFAGLSYYQMRVSAQSTYDAYVQASAVEVVNATHTAQSIIRSQATQSP
jgi:serine/threonine-protein kinase